MSFLIKNLKTSKVMKIEEALETYHSELLKHLLFKTFPNNNLGKDICQEVCLKVLLMSNREDEVTRWFEGVMKFKSYLFQTGNSLLVDHYRREGRKPTVSYDNIPGYQKDASFLQMGLMIEDPCIEEVIILQETSEEMMNKAIIAVSRLAEEQADTMSKICRGFTAKEIAEEEDISINTVLGRIRYAKINMRKTLGI